MKTSVALTSYNGMNYIAQLLDSIRLQQLPPDEVVIVDDCSTDETFSFVDRYIERYGLKNWHNYQNETNMGWRANFREAFHLCSGDLIFVCDQDDIWQPYKIAEMKKIMEDRPEIELLVSNYAVMDIDREEKVILPGLDRDDGTVEQWPFSPHALTDLRPGCTFCARRSLINKLDERDMINVPHDDMLWSYAAVNDSLYLFNRKTILYRRHSDSASTPGKSICRTRRIEEIASQLTIERFFLDVCRRNGDEPKTRLIEKQIRFQERRIDILRSRSPLRMLLFQISSFRHYPTLRNLLADEYVLLFKPD